MLEFEFDAVVGEEVNRCGLLAREGRLEKEALARRPPSVVVVWGMEIDGSGEISCEDSPTFGVNAFLLSFPRRFLRFHYMGY